MLHLVVEFCSCYVLQHLTIWNISCSGAGKHSPVQLHFTCSLFDYILLCIYFSSPSKRFNLFLCLFVCLFMVRFNLWNVLYLVFVCLFLMMNLKIMNNTNNISKKCKHSSLPFTQLALFERKLIVWIKPSLWLVRRHISFSTTQIIPWKTQCHWSNFVTYCILCYRDLYLN